MGSRPARASRSASRRSAVSAQRAQCLLGYGNATQPGSPHLDDQLPFMVQKKLLPVLRDRKEIEASLERRETF